MFEDWAHLIAKNDGQTFTIVASDGKTIRSSNNKIKNEKARHIVSLFLT